MSKAKVAGIYAAMFIAPTAAVVGAVNAAVGFASPRVSAALALAVVVAVLYYLVAFLSSYTFGAAPNETAAGAKGAEVTVVRDFPASASAEAPTTATGDEPGTSAPWLTNLKWALVVLNVVVLFLAGLVAVVNGTIDFVTKVA